MNINVTIRALKRRSPNEWLRLVETIDEPIRTHIAQVVWWDFFAHKDSEDRYPQLDYYLRKFVLEHPTKAPKPEVTSVVKVDFEESKRIKFEEDRLQKIEDFKVRGEMRAALIQIGYPEELANRRVK